MFIFSGLVFRSFDSPPPIRLPRHRSYYRRPSSFVRFGVRLIRRSLLHSFRNVQVQIGLDRGQRNDSGAKIT